LYAVFAAIPIFQLVGSAGRISAVAIMAPIIGVLLGPYLGALSGFLGGTIGLLDGSFLPMSFVSGIVTIICAGLLHGGKRVWCLIIYFLFLVLHGFYPGIGPVWLFPPYIWFQVVGLLLLLSPLQSTAVKNLRSTAWSRSVYWPKLGSSLEPTAAKKYQSKNNTMMGFLSFFVISLTSTLAGQTSGSLTFLVLLPNPPIVQLGLFQVLSVQYPIERTIIALGAAFIGAPLFRVLNSAKLLPLTSQVTSEKRSHENTFFRRHHHVSRAVDKVVKV
jgi:hypothetical protein